MHDETPARTYHLPSPVDLQTALGSLGIDHLIVEPMRLFVIFRSAVLDLRVRQGDLEAADVVALAVLDGPPRSMETGVALRKQLLEQLAPSTGTDWIDNAGR
ncbi:hypothetical protein [Natronococcus jeotgali]|uniref:Uncharacterized protein n=1 Tax=Natronococcus jeotgali DSM 18795 TaxID=1227498 RepID=L9X2V5_9EURY|nr:hypothetical protein [Natronococcus jeotgali]ELY55811.1 hypothetical protein C492_15176 [Natronococcus jeotgali DSM 18795]